MLATLDDPSLLVQRCLLAGEWVGPGDDAVYDPATGACIGRVPHFGARETQQAIDAAAAAFGPWS